MSSSLNVQLTDGLRRYVDERASDKDVYATPGEYIRDLVRQAMQDRLSSGPAHSLARRHKPSALDGELWHGNSDGGKKRDIMMS